MARCDCENKYPKEGLGWRPPELSSIRFESDRLVIRSYELGDVPVLFAAVAACRDRLHPWMAWAKHDHRDEAETTQFIVKQILNARKQESWEGVALGMFLKDGTQRGGAFVGSTGVHDVRRDTASCETGYWVHADHQGKGYATEACKRTIDWALTAQDAGGLGLRRVRIFCAKENTASVRVIEKLGVRKELEMPEDYWVEDVGLTTRMGWGVLASEWEPSAM